MTICEKERNFFFRRERRKAGGEDPWESRDVLTALVEPQKCKTERFASKITSLSTSSIRTKNTFIEVFDEQTDLQRAPSKRAKSLPPALALPETTDLTAISPNQLHQGHSVPSVARPTTLLVEGIGTAVSRGRVFWLASSRGFDISLIKKIDMKPNNRIAISFVDHASAVAFKLMFELTHGEAVGWYDPPPPAKPETPDKHSRLFVGGLSPETTNDSIRALFSSYGDLEEASVILDKRTKLSRGFGFIAFINGYVPPAVLTDYLWLDGKNIGVRQYGSRADKEQELL